MFSDRVTIAGRIVDLLRTKNKHPVGVEDLFAEFAKGAGAFDFVRHFEEPVTVGAYRFHWESPVQYSLAFLGGPGGAWAVVFVQLRRLERRYRQCRGPGALKGGTTLPPGDRRRSSE